MGAHHDPCLGPGAEIGQYMHVPTHVLPHSVTLAWLKVQLLTLGPWLWWFMLNGASKPGGPDDTALLPLVDMLNHDVRQEVELLLLLVLALTLPVQAVSSLLRLPFLPLPSAFAWLLLLP